ncbi:MDR family MFS transporter [Nakamurella sp.]|uniref:MDR family MFS transporter n=1 Tax=Nakamurella sp. TaxID=1869182 RepID=UPI003B3AF4F5
MSARTPPRPTAVVRTLLATQFAFNVGFYAVVPFLAVRLHEDLAATGTAIAVTLAVRTFSQQGMFVVGGALADRYGARRVMVAGTAVRSLGYLALALAGSVPWMIVAAALTGIGGALFSPALESLLAAGGTDRSAPAGPADGGPDKPSRERLFALLAVCGEVGAVLGPVLGALLLMHGFSAVALAGAALFAVVGVVLWLVLPPGRARRPGPRVDRGADRPEPPSWRAALRDRRFVVFCLAYSSYLLSYNQLYVALPVELDRISPGTGTGAGDRALAGLFLLAAGLIVVAQLPVAALTRRLPVTVSLPAGFLLMAAGFAVVAVVAPRPPVVPLLPAIAWVVLLTLGQMTVVPVAMDQVGRFAGPRPAGAYYGALATAGGVAVLLGSLVTGPFLDAARHAVPGAGTAWWLMALFPAVSAVVLAMLFRRARPRASDDSPSDPIPTSTRNGHP